MRLDAQEELAVKYSKDLATAVQDCEEHKSDCDRMRDAIMATKQGQELRHWRIQKKKHHLRRELQRCHHWDRRQLDSDEEEYTPVAVRTTATQTDPRDTTEYISSSDWDSDDEIGLWDPTPPQT